MPLRWLEGKTSIGMKRKHLFKVICAIGFLFTACQEIEKPIPMSMELTGVQLEISGSQAGLVAADTTGLIIVRDSIANEAADTIYNVRTNLTLVLDSTFAADKMEEKLLLNILGADGSILVSLAPTDSMIVDNLMAFLKKDIGEKMEIGFAGSIEENKFLKIENATKVMLIGFSFHQFDPEAMADPAINRLINQYEAKGIKFENLEGEDGVPVEVLYVGDLKERAKLANKLGGLKKKMTPKQLERFNQLQNRFGDNF